MPITDRVAPLHANLTPPTGAVPAGVTHTGKQLFKLTRTMARSVPRLDEDGKQMFRVNPTTGEALPGMPKLRKPEIYEEEQLFYLESDGHNNVHKVFWTPPSEEDLRAAQRRQEIAGVKDQLAEMLVDEGITPQDLIAAIRGGRPSAPAPKGEDAPPELAERDDAGPDAETVDDAETEVVEVDFGEYPKYLKVGTWELCNGEQVGGPGDKALKKEAAQELNAVAQVEMEAAADARSNMDAVPEV